ncbi:MAG: glycoside hydrolase family 127 protein [Kiritimatiellae bacterium]|nr:glycoside hydrolase family 127 protein [Kiritimatiellia bacterium]
MTFSQKQTPYVWGGFRLFVASVVLLYVATASAAGAADAPRSAMRELPLSDMKVLALAGERLDACIRSQMSRKDCAYLSSPYEWKAEQGSWDVVEPGIWQTEFWGKYMHAAVPLADYCLDEGWKRRIGESVAAVIATQLKDGYIGNYREDVRGAVCDVWGAKYTMMGLMHWYDSTGDKAALDACRGVFRWLTGIFGPGKRSLAAEGPFNGLMNCSVLEPVVWLYRRTGDRACLDFARWITEELDGNPEGPEIFRLAAANTPLKDCKSAKSGTKAYEKMSCCQGILDYYEETGDRRLLDTIVAIASQVAAEEIDISGGGTQHERFCGFAERQTRDCAVASEMCVLTTWMRLCEKLLSVTGESRWADEIEKTFYNAYLGGLAEDGSSFDSYGVLGGTRERFHPRQCRMEANCCDSNGARGFVAFLESAVMSSGPVVTVNQHVCGTVRIKELGVVVDQFNDYPRKLESAVTLSMHELCRFSLRIRMPSWSEATTVKTSWGEEKKLGGGGYVVFEREWKSGDQVKMIFDGRVKRHELDGMMAFTRGPVLLARDVRFGDGDLSESFAAPDADRFVVTQPPCASVYMAVTGMFSRYAAMPRPIGFCDFASAGNTRDGKSFFRVWIPVEAE